MSIVVKLFVAPDAEAAAAVAEGGPDGVFESLTFGNFDVEEALIEREGIFTGRSFEEVLDDDVPETVVDPDDGEGPLVLAVSGTLRDALCTAVEHRLAEVSRLWVAERAVGHAAIDRRLYIPRSWTQDPDRCRAAGIPDHTGFATKPALAAEVIAQTLDAGVTASWVTGDEVYGGDPT